MAVSVKRDRIWQRPHIEGRRAEIRRELRADFSPDREKLLGEAAALSRGRDYEGLLRAYLLAVELGKNAIADARAMDGEVERSLTIARAVLATLRIHPKRSRIAFLHRELSLLEMELAAKSGGNWMAAWHSYQAQADASPADSRSLCSLGQRYLRLGDAGRATEAFVAAEAAGYGATDFFQARLAHLHALRLKGAAESARQLAESTRWEEPLDTDRAEAWEWETLKIQLALSGNLRPLILQARQTNRVHRKAEAFLWAAALPEKAWLKEVSCQRAGLRSQAAALAPGSAARVFLEAVRCLQDCQDALVPLDTRLRRLGEMLSGIERVPDSEEELLLLAAAARWLARNKQPDLSHLVRSRYEGLSLRLSGGLRRDALGLFAETPAALVPADAWDASRFRFHLLLHSLPTGTGLRLVEVGKLFLACAGALSRGQIVSRLRASVRDGSLDVDRTLALCEVAAGYLGRMRGPAMKMGQWLGTMGVEIPPESREALLALQDASPAVDPRLLERVIEEDFGRPARELFAEFSLSPFATGSIGQVHRARTREGDEVVVKIQYPGIRRIVESDFQMMRFLSPLFRRALPHWDFTGILTEMQAKMIDECDYAQEARSQAHFHRCYADDPAILVPRVFEAYSSPRVLTSQFISGVPLKEFRVRASQAEKQHAAETMFRWHYECILKHRFFNTDPHGGNYLFLPGKVAFVDFGNVKPWRSRQSEGLVHIIAGLIRGDASLFSEGMLRAEMTQEAWALDLLRHYRQTADGVLRAIARDEEVTIDKSLVARDVRDNLLANPDVYRALAIHKENAYLFKAHWGFYATLSELTPRANWHRIVRPLLNDATLPPNAVN